MSEKVMVTLVLQGLHPSASTTTQAEFIKFRQGAAIIRGYTGRQVRYSLRSGKRLGTNWDFWRLSPESVKMLRRMKNKQESGLTNDPK